MNTKRWNKVVNIMLLILSVAALSCARRVYLDPPVREITVQQKDGITYLNEENRQAKPRANERVQVVKVEYGKASYYADKFHGKPTASGELYDRNKMTAAHRTLAFGTLCRVTNTTNKQHVTVRINDRGPFRKGRIIDLSYQAMRLLDGLRAGEIDVMVEVLK